MIGLKRRLASTTLTNTKIYYKTWKNVIHKHVQKNLKQGRRGRHLCHLFVTYFITWKIFFGRPEAGHKIEKISGRLPAILPCFSEFSPWIFSFWTFYFGNSLRCDALIYRVRLKMDQVNPTKLPAAPTVWNGHKTCTNLRYDLKNVNFTCCVLERRRRAKFWRFFFKIGDDRKHLAPTLTLSLKWSNLFAPNARSPDKSASLFKPR